MIAKKSVTMLRLLLAMNRDDLHSFFRTPYSGLQLRAYGGSPVKNYFVKKLRNLP
eukprot:UN23802